MKGLDDFFRWAQRRHGGLGARVALLLVQKAASWNIPGGAQNVVEAWRGTRLEETAIRVWGVGGSFSFAIRVWGMAG
uniref:Uncharacterized protein n=1 Tax=Chromera velia CCMP2878 TaxID=1169474 RepID=A0A0G4FKZ6_9ALVE|eukprot:Cvel_17554.t1-p1 / transcript=Cvel_17554.t1 / gene=Cvel_17554 / organism=Chromera_velia_CCMP2878 / gene_product=hypothetical protein / transcript_product=hypothetical protein / location=Cvel_scaffold1409:28004-28693(+) / protein_length=76 / sequence_SO=supercontig / SO=protein_coding / is_pseudo=false